MSTRELFFTKKRSNPGQRLVGILLQAPSKFPEDEIERRLVDVSCSDLSVSAGVVSRCTLSLFPPLQRAFPRGPSSRKGCSTPPWTSLRPCHRAYTVSHQKNQHPPFGVQPSSVLQLVVASHGMVAVMMKYLHSSPLNSSSVVNEQEVSRMMSNRVLTMLTLFR